MENQLDAAQELLINACASDPASSGYFEMIDYLMSVISELARKLEDARNPQRNFL
jgi:hypothetical protein